MEAHRTLTGNQINSPGGTAGHSLEKGRGISILGSFFDIKSSCASAVMASNYPNAVQEEVNVRVVLRCSPCNTAMPNALQRYTIAHDTELRRVSVQAEGDGEAPLQLYTFDEVFAPDATQIDVYNRVVTPILDDVLEGFDCTIIAYGQTGTGKTHTMVGSRTRYAGRRWSQDSQAGITSRFLYNISEHLHGLEFPMSVKLCEIYRGATRDLLFEEVTSRHHQNARQVDGLWELDVRSADRAWAILRRGLARRKTVRTRFSARSSRSHVVLSVTVQKNGENGPTGTLNLVDLASSEDFGHDRVADERAQQAGDNQQSRATLSRVIAALAERTSPVPCRDHALTRVLQDSPGRRAKTTIIATVPQLSDDLEGMRLILESASSARDIVNTVQADR